jgi:hypothetical protein
LFQDVARDYNDLSENSGHVIQLSDESELDLKHRIGPWVLLEAIGKTLPGILRLFAHPFIALSGCPRHWIKQISFYSLI